MTAVPSAQRSVSPLLRLGRVSNMPTVWTDVIAASALAGHAATLHVLPLIGAMSAFYLAGMFLNDFFDRKIDARERPDRPIQAGEIGAQTVAVIGFCLLATGLALLAPFGGTALSWGALLAAVIVIYDLWHKSNPFSPLIMGLCRGLVYAVTAVALGGGLPPALVIGAVVLALHVAGLTYAAKQEHLNKVGSLWPLLMLAAPLLLATPAFIEGGLALGAGILLALIDILAVRLLIKRIVPRAVSMLIAAICLVDALAVARAGGSIMLVTLCVLAYPLTRTLQKVVPGT